MCRDGSGGWVPVATESRQKVNLIWEDELLRRLRIFFALCFVLVGGLVIQDVQAQTTGTLEGLIMDDNGSPLPGVSVLVTNVETGLERSALTDVDGFYRAAMLPSGLYSVQASLQGLQTTRQENIRVLVGQILDINLTMGVETVAEVITVTADAPIIEVSRSSAATYVSEEEIVSLPISGRDFTDFAILTPTVKAEPVRGGVSLSGQRGINSGLLLDGTEGKSAFFGYGRGGEATENDGLVVAQDSVKEFQVITNGFAPEYGRNGGGYINVITKSGTNTLKGSAFFFFRDNNLVSDFVISPLDEAKGLTKDDLNLSVDEFQRLNWGASVGGPIIKNKTHFFASYDHTNRDEPFTRSIRTEGVYDAVAAWETSLGIPSNESLLKGFTRLDDGTAQGNFTRSVNNLILFGKIDHQLTENHSLSLRYNYTDYDRTSAYEDEESQKLETTHSIVGSVTSILGDKAVNEFRFQYAKDNLDRLSKRVGNRIEAQIRFRFGSRDSVGKFDYLPIFVQEEKIQIQDNFSYLFGSHDFKIGFDAQIDSLAQLFAGSKDGRYDFRSLEDFPDNPSVARIYMGNVTYPNYDESQTVLGIYAQDSWRPTSNLTVNLGLRWDATINPGNLKHIYAEGEDIPNDMNNISPRLGFAYSMGDGRDVVRGGVGLFYSRTPSLLFASQVQENGLFPNFGRVYVSPGDTGFVPLGDSIDNQNPDPDIIPATAYVDPDFQDPGTWRFNLGYEREIMPDWAAGFDFVYARGFDLTSNVDVNRTVDHYDDFGRPVYSSTRPISDMQQILVRASVADSTYWAATFKINKRWSNGFQFQAHYTYSEDKDSDSNERSATGITLTDAQGDANRNAIINTDYDWGQSDRDIKHRFVFTGVAELPLDFKLSGIVSLQSGTPWTALAGDTRLSNYPGRNGPTPRAVVGGKLVDKNSFRDEGIYNVDMRITKFFDIMDFRVEAFGEVFNLLNTNSFSVCFRESQPFDRSGNANENFGIPCSQVTDQRQFQFGARVSF